MPAVRIRPAAAQDVRGIVRYIKADNPTAAGRFRARLYERFDLLARYPRMAPARAGLGPGIRCLPQGNYLIFYLPEQDGITVLRVLHGARNITPDMFRNR